MKTILAATTVLALVFGAGAANAGFTGGVRVASGDVNGVASEDCGTTSSTGGGGGAGKVKFDRQARRSSSGGGGAGKVKFDRLSMKRRAGKATGGCPESQPSKPRPKTKTKSAIGGSGGGAGKPK